MCDITTLDVEEPSSQVPDTMSHTVEEVASPLVVDESLEEQECAQPDVEIAREGSHKHLYDSFLAELELINNPEEKLVAVISFMEKTLGCKQGTPHFKSFWDARTIALALFKENSALSRAELWGKYTDLSKEARHLKQMLDEQSAFAAEQIEIAIRAIEVELENPSPVGENASMAEVLKSSSSLEANAQYYSQVQSQLNQLNACASRVTALRKELIRTEMRIRQKNKFFQRLSAIGDKVFPARKEAIKELSQKFCLDVDAFIDAHFQAELAQESLFFLREEIKILQNIAKAVTLNTHAFKYTRMRLSKCWDDLKSLDKERKKVRAHQKAVHRQNAEPLYQELVELAAVAEQGPMAEIQQRLDEVIGKIQATDLGRDEVKFLRDKVSVIRKTLLNRMKEDELERSNLMQEKERCRRAQVQEVKACIQDLIANIEENEVDVLASKKDAISAKIGELPISKLEKQELERSLKPLKDAIVEKRERSLMAMSEDDRNALQSLKEILKQRKERRVEIKNQLELFRKSGVSSGLDLEKAISYSEQIAAEKERLEKISCGIKEIEEKISLLEKK